MSKEDVMLFSCYGMRGEGKSYMERLKEKDKEIERLNNIINELEKYINEEYIYDELGMKMFDASTLQDKLQELKRGESNE